MKYVRGEHLGRAEGSLLCLGPKIVFFGYRLIFQRCHRMYFLPNCCTARFDLKHWSTSYHPFY